MAQLRKQFVAGFASGMQLWQALATPVTEAYRLIALAHNPPHKADHQHHIA